MPRGGYRKPANPAPVSGPGALSRRTDGEPTQGARYMAGGQYGEGKQLMDMQRQAPMAASPNVRAAAQAVPTPQLPPITPLTAPTERPGEPFSTGMPFDPTTPGPEVLGLQKQSVALSQTISKLLPYDTTGEISDLYEYLISRGM